METIFTLENILSVVTIVLSVVVVIISYYLLVRKQLENNAIDAINRAEELDKIGAEKMAEAVKIVYDAIPVVAKPFISKELVETVIQAVFDKIESYTQKQFEKQQGTADAAE